MHDLPLLELSRGGIVESIHAGSIAVVDANGRLLHSYGDPQTVAFLRSSAKPFQVLPFVEHGGVKHFGLTQRELALACASHEGSAQHLETVLGMQKKIGIEETQLQCGVHMPGDAAMSVSLVQSGAQPGPNLNNCSGKHTAMLAYAKMRVLPMNTYLELEHPIQQDILTTFAAMCGIEREAIEIGVDGCSAPNFAVPLFNGALGVARLADPRGLSEARAAACREITAAMTAHSEMISGPGEFDCELMKAGAGKIVCKRGAEGYQAIGLLPGALGPDSPGIGITFKVADGDGAHMSHEVSTRARPAVALEILRQLGALSAEQLRALSAFGPARPIVNHRGLVTGEMCPAFTLTATS